MRHSSADNSKGRMHFRLEPKLKERVVRAAAISGQGLTNFAVAALSEKADEILDRHESLELTAEEHRFFLQALSEDRKPSKRSLDAAKKYRAGTRKAVRFRVDH